MKEDLKIIFEVIKDVASYSKRRAYVSISLLSDPEASLKYLQDLDHYEAKIVGSHMYIYW